MSTKSESGEEVDQLRKELERLRVLVAQKDQKVVVMRREKALKIFTGEGNLQEWIEECKVALEDRKGSEAVNFTLQHLGGQAKREVKLHLSSNPTVTDVFCVLTEHFGQIGTFNEAIQTFYARRQRAGEDLRDFSYDLREQLDHVERLKPGCFPNSDEVLRDQLISGIRETTLRRELKEKVADKPRITFMEIRKVALRWSADVPPSPSMREDPRSYKVEVDKELRELKLLVKQQQETIAQLLKADPQPESRVCFKCHTKGHIARNCKAGDTASGQLPSDTNPQPQRGWHQGPRGRGRGRGGYHGRSRTPRFGGRGNHNSEN